MLFNDYAFLLVFLPAAILIYRLADPYPRCGSPCWCCCRSPSTAIGIRLRPAPDARSSSTGWRRGLVSDERPSIVTAAIVVDLAVLAVFKYANFFLANLGRFCGRRCRSSTSRCRSASRSSPSTTSCIWSTCGGKGAAVSARPLRALHLLLPAGDRWSAGALVGGDAPVRPQGLRAGLAAPVRLGASFIVIGLIEKIVLGDPIAHPRPDLRAGRSSARVTDGNAWLALGFGFQILFDFAGYSDIAIGWAAVRRSAAVQFQRTVPLDQHPGFLAALAHDADDCSCATMCSIRSPTCASLGRGTASLQYFGAHAADDGAVRPVARRRAGPSCCGARCTACALVMCSLWRRYGRTPAAGARLGADGAVRAADRRDLPRRLARGGLACLPGP